MQYYIYGDSDELYHHGVKGQKWGVRRNAQSSSSSDRQRIKAAKKNYKAAKKAYNKAFNSWYYRDTGIHVTKKGREASDNRFMKALVASNNMNIAKGKYLQTKGVAKNKPKTIAKGRRLVANATNAKKYNVKVSSLMKKGYTMKQARKKSSSDYNKAIEAQRLNDARYKQEISAINNGKKG